MNNTMSRDVAAYRGKVAMLSALAAASVASLPRLERRNAPSPADMIEQINAGFLKQVEAVKELRARLDLAETRMARPGAFTGGTLALAAGDGAPSITPPTEAERKAFAQLLRTGDKSFALEARAAVNAGTAGQGLEAVAIWFDNVVLTKARDAVPLLGLVRTREVSSFPAKHIVGDGGGGFGWIGEQGIRSGTDSPLPLVVEVPAGEWYALPSITEWALTDLAFDVEQWLRGELIARYGEGLQAAIVAGNGTNKPTGFLAGPTPLTTVDGTRAFGTLRYHPTGQASTLPTTTDTMINLLLDVVHGLKWRHRQNAAWIMSAVTASTLRKFKDADGRPILLDSMITGQPTTLLGYPLVEVEAMPAVGANTFPIAFGDFDAGYVLDVDSSGMRITRDDITEKGFVKYYSRRRVGGKILDSEAIRLIKVAAT